MKRWWIVAIVLCGLPFLAAAAWLFRPRDRHVSVYLIPEHYVGWAVIHHDIPGTPAIPRLRGKLVFTFPPGGEISTSSPQEEGWALDEFYTVSPTGNETRLLPPDGNNGQIWRQTYESITTQGRPEEHNEFFFVGTQDQFHNIAYRNNERSPTGNLLQVGPAAVATPKPASLP